MTPDFLRGFWLSADLLFNLPMREQILMAASRTLPVPFNWIGTALVEHLHNEVTMQAHGRMAKHPFSFCGFRHNCHFNLLLS
jgi:hypothetical protein